MGGDLKAKFLEVYSVLKSELLNDPAFEFTDDSSKWVERVSFMTFSFYIYIYTFLYVYVSVVVFLGHAFRELVL